MVELQPPWLCQLIAQQCYPSAVLGYEYWCRDHQGRWHFGRVQQLRTIFPNRILQKVSFLCVSDSHYSRLHHLRPHQCLDPCLDRPAHYGGLYCPRCTRRPTPLRNWSDVAVCQCHGTCQPPPYLCDARLQPTSPASTHRPPPSPLFLPVLLPAPDPVAAPLLPYHLPHALSGLPVAMYWSAAASSASASGCASGSGAAGGLMT
mmetsp:Transcript_32571/g.54919  ORF Transcript_32571/g.54919 Transcript_32571/m.54919 type:complete len:204 (-) Transcript_32571:649-1260(-)